jgi:hypothetical protein
MSYFTIDLPRGYIRHLEGPISEDDIKGLVQETKERSISLGFVVFEKNYNIYADFDKLAFDLKLPHAPYGMRRLVQFFDDLDTVAENTNGCIVVVRGITNILRQDTEFIVDFLEFFGMSANRWQASNKKFTIYVET